MANRKWLIIIGVAVLCLVASRGYTEGLDNITAWGGKEVFSPGGSDGTASDLDIDGEVGHPVSVFQPQAHCEQGGWTGDMEITSGKLPPGLSFQNNWAITGIPTERGHWIMNIRMKDLECNGKHYYGYTQQVRFHITGTGQVIQ